MPNDPAGSISRCSSPSKPEITDICFTDVVGFPIHITLIKICTNTGLVGLGEV